MIRFASYNDINGIISLWHEAFGDSEEEIRFFLDNRFKPENTLIIEENSAVVSMLFLLDGHMQVKGVDYPAYYLYAACTSESCRGRGLMTELLDFAKEISKKRSIDFICLMPGEKSLFDYYSKHGYQTVFSKRVLEIKREDIVNSGITGENNIYPEYDKFKWDDKAIEFAINHTEFYGGHAFLSCKGYALYSKVDNNMVVKEFNFTPDFLPIFSENLKRDHDFDVLIYYLPAEYPTCIGDYQIKETSMLLPVTDIANSVIPKIKNAYLGLTLD